MAQQRLNPNSLAPDDKLGDTPWDYTNKINDNFDELFGNNTVYLTQESDLPNQTATTWTMDPNIPYKLTAAFSTNLQCIPAAGASFRGDNLGSFTLTYTGTGAMFKGVDVDFFINNVSIDPGIGNMAFDFSETVGGTKRFICDTVEVVSCAVWGTFEDLELVQILNSNGLDADQGVRLLGNNNLIWSVDRLALISTNPTFKGLDLGTASAVVIELNNLFFQAPSGAFGISGLTNSGNVPVGRLGMVANSEFLGGMTDLENISVNDDTRWGFKGNSPTPDTSPDSLISFRGNATETVISTINTPVLVAGTWAERQTSFFSTTSGGRITYLAERPIKAPVDVAVGLISSGGGSIQVTVYLAFNGVVDVESGSDFTISGSSSDEISIPWQTTFNENDYVEVFVENNTNTTNIIVDHAKLRVL